MYRCEELEFGADVDLLACVIETFSGQSIGNKVEEEDERLQVTRPDYLDIVRGRRSADECQCVAFSSRVQFEGF